MKRSEAKPALPAWIFIVTDLALIGAGAVIALRAEEPLTVGSVIAIVACVSLGAIAGLIPLVASYERQKNETLDERQRAIEGMAQTAGAMCVHATSKEGGPGRPKVVYFMTIDKVKFRKPVVPGDRVAHVDGDAPMDAVEEAIFRSVTPLLA